MSKILVACNLPAGLVVEHDGEVLQINGAHNGLNPANLPANGSLDDTPLRVAGYGLTTLEGKQVDAFIGWVKAVTEAPNGAKLQHPFAPIASGALKWSDDIAGLQKELSSNESGETAIKGLDTKTDLPPGVETATDPDAKGDAKKGK